MTENGTTVIENNTLTLTRVFDAPRALVWKAWSDPELLTQWWGPKGWTAPVAKIDFRVDGKYLLAMRGQMGPGMPEVTTWSGGVYKEIVPMDKIVVLDSFTDEQGNLVP